MPVFIDPEKALSSIRKVEDIFLVLEGDLLVCDTYVDSKTFDYLALAQKATSIKILTENVQNETRFRRDLTAFAKEYKIPIEVRKTAGKLHDRYVISLSGLLLFGSNIKDIGKKQSFVVQLSSDFAKQIAFAFNQVWNAAPKF